MQISLAVDEKQDCIASYFSPSELQLRVPQNESCYFFTSISEVLRIQIEGTIYIEDIASLFIKYGSLEFGENGRLFIGKEYPIFQNTIIFQYFGETCQIPSTPHGELHVDSMVYEIFEIEEVLLTNIVRLKVEPTSFVIGDEVLLLYKYHSSYFTYQVENIVYKDVYLSQVSNKINFWQQTAPTHNYLVINMRQNSGVQFRKSCFAVKSAFVVGLAFVDTWQIYLSIGGVHKSIFTQNEFVLEERRLNLNLKFTENIFLGSRIELFLRSQSFLFDNLFINCFLTVSNSTSLAFNSFFASTLVFPVIQQEKQESQLIIWESFEFSHAVLINSSIQFNSSFRLIKISEIQTYSSKITISGDGETIHFIRAILISSHFQIKSRRIQTVLIEEISADGNKATPHLIVFERDSKNGQLSELVNIKIADSSFSGYTSSLFFQDSKPFGKVSSLVYSPEYLEYNATIRNISYSSSDIFNQEPMFNLTRMNLHVVYWQDSPCLTCWVVVLEDAGFIQEELELISEIQYCQTGINQSLYEICQSSLFFKISGVSFTEETTQDVDRTFFLLTTTGKSIKPGMLNILLAAQAVRVLLRGFFAEDVENNQQGHQQRLESSDIVSFKLDLYAYNPSYIPQHSLRLLFSNDRRAIKEVSFKVLGGIKRQIIPLSSQYTDENNVIWIFGNIGSLELYWYKQNSATLQYTIEITYCEKEQYRAMNLAGDPNVKNIEEGSCISNCAFLKYESRICTLGGLLGHYQSTQLLKRCSENCSECISSSVCSKCAPTFYHYQSACFLLCPIGTYSVNYECKNCDDLCHFCKENGECYAPRQYSIFQQSQRCKYGEYRKGHKCIKCIEGCSICAINSPNTCLQCESAYYKDNLICKPEKRTIRKDCTFGQFLFLEESTCQACDIPNCVGCRLEGEQKICTQCDSSFQFLESNCHKCPPGQFLLFSSCVNCSQLFSTHQKYNFHSIKDCASFLQEQKELNFKWR